MGEAIARLYEGDQLAAALAEARTRTLALYSHLDLSSLVVPRLSIVNPPLWELSHVAWFQEHWCVRYAPARGGLARGSQLHEADALFDSRTVPHDTRWQLPLPAPRVLFSYMKATLDATLEALARTPPERRYFFALALFHEDMHAEAFAMTLQTLGLPPPPLPATPPQAQSLPELQDIEFAPGEYRPGVERDAAVFAFDNEKWAHPRFVPRFRMASRPVSQGEFAAFVDAGGYEQPSLWSQEGWAWRQQMARRAPLYWRRDGGSWQVRRFDKWHDLLPDLPMVHVSLHEATAYCRWAGRRLPTEAEWEFAARDGDGHRYPWGDEPPGPSAALDFTCQGPQFGEAGLRASRRGLSLLLGGVWEWTASPFIPYPGFTADPYREYSEPWFESHYALRGGSFATRSRLIHNRFRNFYLPDRADIFAGIRTCAVEDTPGVS